jgi:signal transduction histidine kinase/CheY-like chemotaxis protein
MAEKTDGGGRKSPKAREPHPDRRSARRASARPSADDLAEINEQLLTEREELQRQTLELTELNAQLRAKQEAILRRNLELQELQEKTERGTGVARGMQLLAGMAEDYPDPALRVSRTGRVRYVNPAALGLRNLWNPPDSQQVPPAVQKIVSAAYVTGEVLRREMTFGQRAYLLTVVPAPPPADYVNIFASDITALKQAEEALRESNAELEHRARQLQRLALELTQTEERERRRMAEILHDDLQQIIAAAKFRLSVMRSRAGHDAPLQELAAQVEQMLKDAIDKSRSLSHELSPAALYRSDLNEALDWLAGQMRSQHGLLVQMRAPVPVSLASDTIAALLYRTAQELLFNVVKHAHVNEAGMAVRRHGRWVCLSVSDRGAGFDPQELAAARGYGLLGIRERIGLLGGCVKTHSAKGKGSRFFIAVPDDGVPEGGGQKTEDGGQKIEGGERKTEDRRKTEEEAPSSVLRVLLADDHRIVRESLRLLLHGADHVEIVGEAAHGREAVDLALRLEPDVVIMDVSMPLIDGDMATRQIKEHLPKTRVIALSTYNEPEMRAKMFRAGAEQYVLKTASADELLAALRGKKSEA